MFDESSIEEVAEELATYRIVADVYDYSPTRYSIQKKCPADHYNPDKQFVWRPLEGLFGFYTREAAEVALCHRKEREMEREAPENAPRYYR